MNVCQLRRQGAQIIPNDAERELYWDSEEYDPNNMHATGGTGIDAPTAGYYYVFCMIRWAPSAQGTRLHRIRMNGVRTEAQDAHAHAYRFTDAHGVIVYMNAGNTAYVTVYQDSGADLNVEGGPNQSYFGMFGPL